MQYGRIGEDLSKSRIELLEDFSNALPTESVESLDSFLPQFHNANIEQLEIERRVVAYLRSLGIQFKTDPRQKETDYYDKPKKNVIIFQQTIGESPQLGPISSFKFGLDSTPGSGIWLKPIFNKKQQSFEL